MCSWFYGEMRGCGMYNRRNSAYVSHIQTMLGVPLQSPIVSGLDVLPYNGFLLIVHFHYTLCCAGIFMTGVVEQLLKLCGVNLTRCLLCWFLLCFLLFSCKCIWKLWTRELNVDYIFTIGCDEDGVKEETEVSVCLGWTYIL